MDEDNHLARGRNAEQLACRYLNAHGLRLVECNYRCAAGELDLVMRHNDSLVFVEVRYRSNTRFGSGADTVGRRKQAKLIAAALHYLQRRKAMKYPCRFDVVSIDAGRQGDRIQWIQDAFQA